MDPFFYERPTELTRAAARAAEPGAMIYAGGTTMLDLMKHKVYAPERVIDITRLREPGLREIRRDGDLLVLGALVTMHQAAEDATVKAEAPAISESLWLAATQQLRHMATLGGNVLQRTRDPYFRDPSWQAVLTRNDPRDSGEPEGANRLGAVLGTTETFLASYPGDFAQSLAAFGATVEITGPDGARSLPFTDLHVLPADREAPDQVTRLAPGEIITAFRVDLSPATRRSTYIKVRDRSSYAFANASCAAGLAMEGETVADVRLGLGGVATVPWRATAAEEVLRGERPTDDAIKAAAEAAFADARTFHHNAFKVPLGQNTIRRALTVLRDMEG
ncbi:FAD binding domain-containing protein [Jannaschia aquimarina]|uniref:CoxM_1 protein n=1 Tax=Jannaschia aquimarina TaxID=935700 RepID=A0A0D1EKL6_9RHOB|nr:FAD binding domain-containing protein [Jannaschia aquimarina]KIT17561.1 Carbon monoxide dehydrogenase medium chain [Jannaschia aquimarina]SNS72821.1 xanthine dehydrogenase YagS FAD-binding subunit [Jannaschia aquimarina]